MDGDVSRRWTRKICDDEGVDEWMRTRKREGLGVGVRKQLIRPCTGDVRTMGAPSDQPFALGWRGQSCAKIRIQQMF